MLIANSWRLNGSRCYYAQILPMHGLYRAHGVAAAVARATCLACGRNSCEDSDVNHDALYEYIINKH